MHFSKKEKEKRQGLNCFCFLKNNVKFLLVILCFGIIFLYLNKKLLQVAV